MIKISKNYVSVGKKYNTAPSFLWDVISDTRQWPKWGPTVKNVQSTDRFIKMGSEGKVQTVLGIWLPFVVTDYNEERNWNWRVGSIQATGHRLETDLDGRCALWFDVPFWATPYLIACQMALVRIHSLIFSKTHLS